MNCLKVIRWAIAFPLMILLFIIVTVGVTLATFAKVTTDRSSLKQWLDEGNVYEQVVDLVFNEVIKQAEAEDSPDQMPVSEGELKDIVKGVLTEEWLQEQTEGAIDASYAWLNGETESPQINISLDDKQDEIIEAMSSVLKQKITDLPECTSDQSSGEFNPFEAECKPPGFEMNAEFEQFFDEQFSSQDFLGEVSITPDKINIDPKVSQRVQQGYSIASKLPVAIWAIIAVFALILFLVIPGLKKSFLFTGLILFLSSGLLLLVGYTTKRNFDSFVDTRLRDTSFEYIDTASLFFKGPVKLAYFDIVSQGARYSVVLVVVGMILILGSFILLLIKPKYFIKDADKREDEGEAKQSGESVDEETDVIKEGEGIRNGRPPKKETPIQQVPQTSPDENGTSVTRKVNKLKKGHDQ